MMGNNIISYIVCTFGMIYTTAGLTSCCNVITKGTVIEVACPGCRLQTVPDDLPINTTELNLHNNTLTVLHKDSFRYLHQLDNLILSSNGLSLISSGAFDGLKNLKYLYLSNNLLDNSSFDVYTFKPLICLTYIDLKRNKFHLKKTYPEHAIPYLSQVETLQIDIFEGFHFGAGFLNLTKLKQLDFTVVETKRISIHNSTFIGLTRSVISHLELRFRIHKLEINAFAPFRNLVTLIFDSGRSMNIRDVLKVLYGLQNRKMEYLALTGNYILNVRGVLLEKSDFIYLRTICVRRLDLTKNDIEGIAMAAILSWSSRNCLEILDISSNSLKSPQLLFFLSLFPSITHVSCSNQRTPRDTKRSVAFESEQMVFLQPSLIYLNMSRVGAGGPVANLTLHKGNNLQVVDVSYPFNHLRCSYGRIRGLVHLTELYMSGLECSRPNLEMFADMTQLAKLEAKQCSLGHVLAKDNTVLFKGRKNLTVLDLSGNYINVLSPNIFEDQQLSLETLVIASNNLISLHTHILTKLQKLKTLDVSHNLITKLTKSDMTFLDAHRMNFSTFTLNLLGNPLVCSCEVLDFLHWVGITNVLYNKDDLSCSTPDGSQMKIMTFLQTFDEFQETCATQFWLVTSLIMSIVLIFTIFVSRVVWRRSVKLRVWCRQPLENEEFQFDVFINFCNEDSTWTALTLVPWLEQENIECCFDDKSFDLRLDLCDNIMNAIDNSRKSIFVVSCNYFKSEWQTFSMKLTSVYAFRDGRENMNVIILLDDLGRSEFPKLIRKNWNEISPITWPDENTCAKNKLTKAKKKFWEKLLKRIKRGNTRFNEKLYSESTL